MKSEYLRLTTLPLEQLCGELPASQTEIELCSIVNVKSGRCSMDCRFCAQSAHYQTGVCEYPLMEPSALRTRSVFFWEQGVHRVGWVAGGCSIDRTETEQIAMAAQSLQGNGCLCASLGQLSGEALSLLKQSGINRYHHNLESSERYYPNLCSTQSWRDRLETVCRAKELGMEVCSGGLFGLGESWEDRIELALTLRSLQVDSVPINFLQPIPGTPLADRTLLSAEEALRIIAVFRIILPHTRIRICGGRPIVLEARQNEIFRFGADALMTGDYLTTRGNGIDADKEMIQQNG